MNRLDEQSFRMLVGGIILALTIVQAARMRYAQWFDHMPHQTWFAILLGVLAGLATMLANAAGPVVALYLLAVTLPKWELIGTSAWFFLVLNVSKLPFSYNLGLIDANSLWINFTFTPFIPLGILSGRWLANRISQAWFNGILLSLTALASLHLLGLFKTHVARFAGIEFPRGSWIRQNSDGFREPNSYSTECLRIQLRR